jgi:hypothetical protein
MVPMLTTGVVIAMLLARAASGRSERRAALMTPDSRNEGKGIRGVIG